MEQESRPTLTQVAERAGVSVASASRVLNGLPATPAMTDRVRSAVRDLGYVADATARSLKVRRTEQLVLAVADIGNPVYVAMMRAAEEVIRGAGYRLVITSIGSNPDEGIAVLQSLARGYADGMILSPLRVTDALVEELTATRVPVVVIGSLPPGTRNDNVRANSARGVGLAMEHLTATGRRSVAFVNGPVDTVPGSARQRGYDTWVKTNGGADHRLLVHADDFTFADGIVAVEKLLDQAHPDAIVCANDLLAVSALHVLRARGLRVPDDVAVVGMDDSDLAQLATPPLTSVYLGSYDRGRIAAELLLKRLADPTLEPTRRTVQPRLSIRESSAAAGRGRSTNRLAR